MAKPTGFLEHDRKTPPKRSVAERLKDFREIEQLLPEDELLKQASRCMDCGVPFCHSFGCPLGNVIPEWNDMVYRGQWRKALELLHATNNFPEVTGRICPALCEASCTLNLEATPVAIKQIELQIVERGWREGWIRPQPAPVRTGFKVAVIGSGPAGLAVSQQLARAGHDVTLFEEADRLGGILRYGIPDYKLEKWVLDRRLEQMAAEGVRFETRVQAGVDISAGYLTRSFDAIVITSGARVPRDLPIPGRNLPGVHFALDYLTQQNRINAGDSIPEADRIEAGGRDVIVIGGGDTGSDCIGTANRQGARSVTQLELLAKPPETPAASNPWPTWPTILRTSTSHEEGCERRWSVNTSECVGDEDGHVARLRGVEIDWTKRDAKTGAPFSNVPGSEFELPAQLVLLAMGFVHAEHGPLVKDLGLEIDKRGNILVADNFMTSVGGVFAAGDSTRGASLVVHAINLGRKVAEAVDGYLRADAERQVEKAG